MRRKVIKSEKLDRIMSRVCWVTGVLVAALGVAHLGSPDLRRTATYFAAAAFFLLAPWLKRKIDGSA